MKKYSIVYVPKAVKQFSKFPKHLQDEYKEILDLLPYKENHERLRVHKLSGILKDAYSARVNFEHRIVFAYDGDLIVVMLLGDHSIYR